MSSRNSLSREDWIAAARGILIQGGIDAVRVDTLARALKITRGSFYHHFKSRQELLDAVLADWRATATEHIIKNLRDTGDPPREQLRWLLSLPLHGRAASQAASVELAIRAWARRDRRVRQAMDEIDGHRLRFIQSLLEKIPPAKDTESRAHLIYAYQLSLSMVRTGTDEARLANRQERIAALLLPDAD